MPADFSHMELKADHEQRPLWIWESKIARGPNGNEEAYLIILEAFSPMYKVATDFLIAIAEPTSRPSHIHEYQLTKFSIYAAASVGLSDEDIINVLQRLCKNKEVPREVDEFIRHNSKEYGKAKLVLRRNEYFIETTCKSIMERLMQFKMRVKRGILNNNEKDEAEVEISMKEAVDLARTERLGKREREEKERRRLQREQAAMNDLDEKQERRRQEQRGNKPIQEEVVSQQMLLLQSLQRDFQVFLDVEMSESDEDEKLFQQPSL